MSLRQTAPAYDGSPRAMVNMRLTTLLTSPRTEPEWRTPHPGIRRETTHGPACLRLRHPALIWMALIVSESRSTQWEMNLEPVTSVWSPGVVAGLWRRGRIAFRTDSTTILRNWSPDGQRIAFSYYSPVYDRSGHPSLYRWTPCKGLKDIRRCLLSQWVGMAADGSLSQMNGWLRQLRRC